MVEPSTTSRFGYDSMAWIYEFISGLFSFGQIRATKVSQIAEIRPDDKVLYVGVGSAEDAILAARTGAQVTCLDLSEAMLKLARRRFERKGQTAEWICGDVMQHDRIGYYDVVAANFFLNLFAAPLVRPVLAHLAELLCPGGKMLIADFAGPRGNLIRRALQHLYFMEANFPFWLLGKCELHPICDYVYYFEECGLQHVRSDGFPLFGGAVPGYENVIGSKK